MPSRNFQDKLSEQVRELEAAYYANSGDAFCHWAMKTYFELDDDETIEACDIGGPRDRGLDAFWHDEDQRRIVLAQAKYTSNRRGKVGAEPVIAVERAYKWLRQLADEGSRQAKKELRAAAMELARCREEDPDYQVDLYCFASRPFTVEAHEQAALINEEFWEQGVRLNLVGLEQLEEAVREQHSRLAEPPIEISLDLEKYFEFEQSEGPRTIVASVNVRALADLEKKFHYRIFQRNVRYFLKATNRVNRGIESTLLSPNGRSRFWYYNNGIAIVCDEIIVSKGRANSGKATVKNLQIVNGCQTTTTLGELADELESGKDSPAFVLVRFIESEDLELQGEISRFNNKQSAVKDRDLMSNDDPQARLEKELDVFNPPWFFQRKRGQWDAEVRSDPVKKMRFGDRKIDNEAAAQAAYAFWRDPAIARARKRMLFVRKSEEPTGLYDQIFTDSTSPEWILLPFRVQEYVAHRKRTYMHELKSALETSRPSVKEKRILGKQWLKFADQVIVAAIRLYWEEQLDIARIANQRKLLSDESFDDAARAGYDLAIRDLNPFFRQKAADGERRREPFDAANFLKGNWTEIREWIEDQIDYHRSEAFEGIPAFGD
jgi:AIPR protein